MDTYPTVTSQPLRSIAEKEEDLLITQICGISSNRATKSYKTVSKLLNWTCFRSIKKYLKPKPLILFAFWEEKREPLLWPLVHNPQGTCFENKLSY